jgi:hypothetical protein
MHFRKAALGLLVFLLLPSCSLFGSEESKQDELQRHWEIWQEQDISNYRFNLSVGCFCPRWPYPAEVKVRSDTVVAVFDPETGDTLRNPRTGDPALQETPGSYKPIDDLFEVIGRAIDEDYHRLSVEYNDRFGYPKKIDYEVAENLSDDQVTYDVSNFEVN